MRSVTYSSGVSLDGYIAGPHGDFSWTEPDEEVFRFVTDEIREVGVHLLGRRLCETMLYWETTDHDHDHVICVTRIDWYLTGMILGAFRLSRWHRSTLCLRNPGCHEPPQRPNCISASH